MLRALVLEDDACSALALSTLLGQAGLEVTTVSDTDEALREVARLAPDILLADWGVLGEVSSLEVARQVRKLRPEARLVFISGFSRRDIEREVAGLNPCTVYDKPVNFDELLSELESSSGGRLSQEPSTAAHI